MTLLYYKKEKAIVFRGENCVLTRRVLHATGKRDTGGDAPVERGCLFCVPSNNEQMLLERSCHTALSVLLYSTSNRNEA